MNDTIETGFDGGVRGRETEVRSDATFVQSLIAAACGHPWIVGLTTLIGVAAAVGVILASPTRYTARLVIMPTEASQQLSDLLRNAGGGVIANSLGSLTGNDQVTYFDRFNKQLTGVGTGASLKSHPGLVESLMDLTWNDNLKAWQDTSPLGRIKGWVGFDNTPEVTAQSVAEYLRKYLVQDPDRDSPITTLSIEAQDPEVAKRTLEYLYQYADDQIKQATSEQTQSKLEYLQRRLQGVTVNDYRQTMIGLILDQEKILMLIQPNLPFAAQKLEAAEVLSDPTSPRKGRVIALGAILGLFVGVGFAYRRDRRRRRF